jgi:hypothetical protein
MKHKQDWGMVGLKPKDLCGIPWMVAFALRADGWYLRSDIIWNKPNPMPESVEDRPTKSHEYIFLLSKAKDYYYDAEAIKEATKSESFERAMRGVSSNHKNLNIPGQTQHSIHKARAHGEGYPMPEQRNKRSVWTVPTLPYGGAHFATFPPDLIKPCILAGTSSKGCCVACGAPWERVMERDANVYNEKEGAAQRLRCSGVISGGTDKVTLGVTQHVKRQHLGWRPTCKCGEAADILPCIVLDPFAGSGTSGKVAIELGRRVVLIELNPNYIPLIEKRCQTTMGLPLAV